MNLPRSCSMTLLLLTWALLGQRTQTGSWSLPGLAALLGLARLAGTERVRGEAGSLRARFETGPAGPRGLSRSVARNGALEAGLAVALGITASSLHHGACELRDLILLVSVPAVVAGSAARSLPWVLGETTSTAGSRVVPGRPISRAGRRSPARARGAAGAGP